MIRDIARQEVRSTLREGRFRIAAITLGVLFALSLFGAYDYYRVLEAQHAEAAATARAQWVSQGDKNPHSAAHYGTYVFKPIYPLSYFDRGVDAFTGNTLFLEAHRSNQSSFKAAEDLSDVARLGTLTPAFVLGILMPLFIVVLGFGAAAAERENGNLRLLLAQGVGPGALFWGKSLGLWAVVVALALPFFLAGAIGLVVGGGGGEDWGRYALIAALYLVYFGCFIHVTLALSAWARRPSVALVSALAVWVVACLVVPKAAVDLARQVHPAPSWQAYNNAIKADLEAGLDGHDATDAYTKRLEAETLAEHGVDSVHQLPFNWDGFVMQKSEEHETVVYQRHKADLLEVYQRQRGLHLATAVLSPFVLTSVLSQRLAGTDVDVYFDFLAAAERYRVALVGELNADLTDNFAYGDWGGKRGGDYFQTNADFDYARPTLSAVVAELALPAGALVAWLLISGALAALAFRDLKPA